MITTNFNPSVLTTQRNLNNATNNLNTALYRMSTGYRVNCAADDAAGMFLSSNMTAQIRGLTQARKNTQDALSYLSTAEGAINNMTDILNRIRDLAVQASNGIYSDDSREAMQAEADALVEQLFQIKSSTNFNGSSVFKIQEDAPVSAALFSMATSRTMNSPLATASFRVVSNSDSVSASTPPPETPKNPAPPGFWTSIFFQT